MEGNRVARGQDNLEPGRKSAQQERKHGGGRDGGGECSHCYKEGQKQRLPRSTCVFTGQSTLAQNRAEKWRAWMWAWY